MNRLIIVGGGLFGSLLARQLARVRPEVDWLLFERGSSLGGEHTWSFHGSDIEDRLFPLISDLTVGAWDEYTVRFPGLSRRLTSRYFSITSDRFHERLSPELGQRVHLRQAVREVGPTFVTLEDGSRHDGSCVIDARGFSEVPGGRVGYQKFVGLDVRLETPHGLKGPVVMDATVIQSDGFRFVYLLPWDSHRVLIEDTYYSGTPRLSVESIKKEIHFYAVRKGWKISHVDRVEVGCLPIPLDIPQTVDVDVPTLGVRGGFFNLTTGYSVPDAVATVDKIAGVPRFTPESVRATLSPLRKRHQSQARFYAGLNRMLFLACEPEQRYRVIERFYRLPETTIQRFYRGTLTWADAARILVGKPPVPIRRAMTSLWGKQEVLV